MPSVNPRELQYEGIHLTQADFVAAKDEEETLAAGELGQVAQAEIGEDGQLSNYEAVRLGDNLDQTGNSPKGKIFVELQGDLEDDGTYEVVDDRTQIRWIVSDKNSNRRIPVTRWFPHRDLNQQDPRLRTPLPPVTRNNNPFFAKSGRLIILEAKNEATDTEVSLANSTFEIPSRAGY